MSLWGSGPAMRCQITRGEWKPVLGRIRLGMRVIGLCSLMLGFFFQPYDVKASPRLSVRQAAVLRLTVFNDQAVLMFSKTDGTPIPGARIRIAAAAPSAEPYSLEVVTRNSSNTRIDLPLELQSRNLVASYEGNGHYSPTKRQSEAAALSARSKSQPRVDQRHQRAPAGWLELRWLVAATGLVLLGWYAIFRPSPVFRALAARPVRAARPHLSGNAARSITKVFAGPSRARPVPSSMPTTLRVKDEDLDCALRHREVRIHDSASLDQLGYPALTDENGILNLRSASGVMMLTARDYLPICLGSASPKREILLTGYRRGLWQVWTRANRALALQRSVPPQSLPAEFQASFQRLSPDIILLENAIFGSTSPNEHEALALATRLLPLLDHLEKLQQRTDQAP